MKEEDRGLKEFILSQIREKGAVPFSQFMEWCLYHPEYGYYCSGGTKIGAEGDYYSSPCVHPLFGTSVAKQLEQMDRFLGEDVFEIYEMGGGRGFLCGDILDWAKRRAPSFYRRIRYTLIENSPFFLRDQKERLAEYAADGKVFWADSGAFEGGAIQCRGCFLSNELIDAFPVHRVVFHEGALKEIYVSQKDGRFAEEWASPSDERIPNYFTSMGIRLTEGQKAEVNLRALDWVEKVARCLHKGFVLSIDYGYLAEELYTPLRPEGTLLCYFRHQTSDKVYERLGTQDMTSHVNFTALIQKGKQVGLGLTGLVPQYRFLLSLGILREIESLSKERSPLEALRLRLSVKHLIEPEAGMGEVFKVLIQHKGVDPPPLDGVRDLDLIPWPYSREGGVS